MSRPKTPTVLKLVKGTTQPPCRTNKNEPKPDNNRPKPPSIVTGAALNEWKRIMPQLEAVGLVSLVDRAALAAYCVAYGRWIDAEKSVAEHGYMLKAPNNLPMPSPYLSVANKAMEQMMKAIREFGLSPASRSSVSSITKPESKKMGIKERFSR